MQNPVDQYQDHKDILEKYKNDIKNVFADRHNPKTRAYLRTLLPMAQQHQRMVYQIEWMNENWPLKKMGMGLASF